MLDAKLLRENPVSVENMLKRRGIDFPLDELIALDKKRRRADSGVTGFQT